MEFSEEQIDKIRRELQSRGKIAAVKICRELSGSTLMESKRYVESLPVDSEASSVPNTSESSNISDEQMDEILDALEKGNKVLAVKLYKEGTGASLMESKTFIERLMGELGIEGRTGCTTVILMVITLGTAISTLIS